MDNQVSFTVIDGGNKQTIHTTHGAYLNLMHLLKDQLFLDDFGECGGVGRCATCVVKVSGLKGDALLQKRNEPATLSKLGHNENNIRLSCQLYITKDLNDSVIEIIQE